MCLFFAKFIYSKQIASWYMPNVDMQVDALSVNLIKFDLKKSW